MSDTIINDADIERSDASTEAAQTGTLPVRVITPHHGFDAFTDAAKSIVRDFDQSRALAWRLFVRDTKATYRQSLLGYVWLFLPPLATAFVWVFLTQQELVSIDTGDVPYPVFVLTGSILWAAFNTSVMGMQAIMSEARSVLSKVNFPHEALVLSAIGKSLLNTVVPALVLIPGMIAYGISFQWTSLLFPLGFLALILLGCAVGLILVPIASLYTDIGRGIQLGLRFGFFVTPVIFTMPKSGFMRTLLIWNPVSAPLVTSRHWLIGSESSLWVPTVAVFVISAIVLGLATIVFKVTMPHIIERLNS